MEREERDDTPAAGDGQACPASWQETFRMRPFSALTATAFGVGLLPVAPGTWGSVVGVAVAEGAFAAGGLWALAAVAAGASAFGAVATEAVLRVRGETDPPAVVVDEVAGQALALLLVHAWGPHSPGAALRWGLVTAAFAGFRLLDIFKPGPIARAERLAGGFGVMADDLLAGLIAGGAVALAARLLPA
jgi:phosphatidylglycerophosphatase A